MPIYQNIYRDGDHAAPSDVRLGVVYANDKAGLVAVPVVSDVILGVAVDQTVGNNRQATETDVRLAVAYGPNDGLIGSLDTSGNDADYPAVSDVRLGVEYADGALTGNVREPPEANVLLNYLYGTRDTLTGQLDAGDPTSSDRDWVTR